MNSFSIFSSPQFFESLKYDALPPDFLVSVQKVLDTKSPQIVHSEKGKYLIEFNPLGPFSELVDGWLPVKIYCLQKWKSGGIKVDELREIMEEQKNSPDPELQEPGEHREGGDSYYSEKHHPEEKE